MIAVIETGGKQYTVQLGNVLNVETLAGKENEKIVFSRVLLLSDGKSTQIGMPFLDATVEGEILSHGRGEKIRVYKMHAKKRYQKTQGHRQNYTEVRITKIAGESYVPAKSVKKEKMEKVEEKEVKKESAKKSAPKKEAPKKAPAKKTTAKKASKE